MHQDLQDALYKLDKLEAEQEVWKAERKVIISSLQKQNNLINALQKLLKSKNKELEDTNAYARALQVQYAEATGSNDAEDEVIGRMI